MPPAVMEQLRHNLGLDAPIHIRYIKWLIAFAHGDFGYSFAQSRPVIDILKEAVPNTLMLTAGAIVLVFGIGIIIGMLQAVKQHSFFDSASSIIILFFY